MDKLLYDILTEKLNMLETGRPDLTATDAREIGHPVLVIDRVLWLAIYEKRDQVLHG